MKGLAARALLLDRLGEGTASAAAVAFDGSMTGASTAQRVRRGASQLARSTLAGTGSSSLGSFEYSHDAFLSAKGPVHGRFLLNFSVGDRLEGSVVGAATATPTLGLFDLILAYRILGGTGQFLGATGAFEGIGTVDRRVTLQVAINFAAVAEPVSWTTMLIGFASIGSGWRQRIVPEQRARRVGAAAIRPA